MRADLTLLAFTFELAAISTALLLPIGVGLAWLLSHRRGWVKGLVEAFVSLPLVLPPTAVGFLLLRGLAPNSALGSRLARAGVEVLFTPKAVVLATMTMSLPLLVRGARASFEEVDPRLLGMARTLGCSRAAAFVRVALPLAWRGILAGAVMAFARAIGEFGATVLVAGNIPGRTQTIALAIFQRVELGDTDAANHLVLLTVVFALLAMVGTEWLAGRRTARLRA
jgi:molybdate transport system permease protein